MTQCLPPLLTPLDTALVRLLGGLDSVAPIELPLADARGCVAAEMPPLAACPPHDIAAVDGWALSAGDVVGASSYSPAQLAALPAWVEAGDAMPSGCDCVLDAAAVDTSGPIAEVLADGVPGRGVRRAGSDHAGGKPVVAAGLEIRTHHLLLARAAGLKTLSVRRPRLRLVNVPGGTATAAVIAELARTAGADAIVVEARARDAESVADAADSVACDLLLTIGGSGPGRCDATVAALSECGELLAHGIALHPGKTTALGRIGTVPVIALPGSPDQALAAWLALALPLLDRLSGRQSRKPVSLPLARKVASGVGIAELALLANDRGTWLPLAAGDLPLQAIARADAWLLVPANSEGFAAGAAVDAYLMWE
ncbi:molybdopterin-binding protein [Bradyrhizobium sp.]|uniref:molybdopterin-binding protein n=1 Tax=Bradyrhizobium sp. TaxID=376 RepID=UPI00238CAB9A|nr:molybdopterin-binding protein [Bradyrhizobium sp.]MDE2377736.1 molybdopterin-binding protein [Bradyrhizobium sp.]